MTNGGDLWDRLRQTVFEMRCVWRRCCLFFQGNGENESCFASTCSFGTPSVVEKFAANIPPTNFLGLLATGIQRSQGACVAFPEAFRCAPVDQQGDGKGTVVLLMVEIRPTS